MAAAVAIPGQSIAAAEGSPRNILDFIQRNQSQIDEGNDAAPALARATQANCDVSQALSSALRQERGAFNEALERAKENLEAVAQGLDKLGGRARFPKRVNVPPNVLSLLSPDFTSISTGDDVLKLIGKLAAQSAAAITKIQSGKGTDSDFTLIATNSAKISELVLIFYDVLRV